MWLITPVEETDKRGRTIRTTRNKDEGRGSPQGSPISPLLANLYMRRFVMGWKVLGHEQNLQARIVNYADDFVICCRGTAAQASAIMRNMMSQLKLTINETKTRLRRLPEVTFDFLGYTFGLCYKPQTGRKYLNVRPAKVKVARIIRSISDVTRRTWLYLEPEEVVGRLNRKLVGWANYFCLGPVSKAYRAVDAHVQHRLRQWLCARHQIPGRGIKEFPDEYLYSRLCVQRLETRTSNFPWANARRQLINGMPCPRAGCGKSASPVR